MIHECSVLQPLRQRYAAVFPTITDTMRSFFAQQDHLQIFNFVLDCFDAAEFCIVLGLHAIRLVSWLKHCNLSLSVSVTV